MRAANRGYGQPEVDVVVGDQEGCPHDEGFKYRTVDISLIVWKIRERPGDVQVLW
jgi:hypothetical protein